MAGFDLATQRSGTITGFGRIEGGIIDFSASSATVDVPTRLNTLLLGFGIADSTQSAGGGVPHTLIATAGGDVSSAAVTLKRQGPYIDADARFHYVLFGY